ncbi:alpha-tocopherol transfer protein-like [Toxorhynchites rutilus septentrionalis]|uniref:alpha-tocopherol transfer protein-like n=1 Tax=Toxorhynchites rutilus septentrionalis TaxID=329112 RepID=UPI0024786F49|nr:alpha-tocopherol transfer protein-like [Toxorhynchites rutilus septentrionalis]
MTVSYGVEKCPKQFDEYRCSLSEKFRQLAMEQLREDDTLREQALEAMRVWIAKHPYIRRCRTDSLFLLRFLRQRKFSIPLACETLERYLAMRQTFPHWFQKLDPTHPDMKELIADDVFQALGFDDKGRILILIKSKNFNVEKFTLVHLIRYLHMYMEIMSCDERIQVGGIVLIVDCLDTTMMHFTLFNLSDMKNMMPYINHLLPVRCKEIHVIRLPKMSVALVEILFSFVSPKLKHRFHFHKTMIDAKKHLDKSLLPAEYNGTNDSQELTQTFHRQIHESKDELAMLDEMEIDITKYTALWNQNHPTGGCGRASEIETGMVGSFRKLNID